jgi:hypothetical protein
MIGVALAGYSLRSRGSPAEQSAVNHLPPSVM